MTDIDTIRFLWRYMVHADEQILAAAQTAPAENYDQEQGISFGSLPKLLNHARLAQKVWIRRLNGADVMYMDEPVPPRDQFAGVWAELHRDMISFADGQTDESLQRMIRSHTRTGKQFEVPAGVVMLHVADHATYHRGQINSMIKRAGGTPSAVMLYMYAVAKQIGREL